MTLEDKKKMFEYVLKNVYPIVIESLSPSHAGRGFDKKVTFAFDCMYVESATKKLEVELKKHLMNML